MLAQPLVLPAELAGTQTGFKADPALVADCISMAVQMCLQISECSTHALQQRQPERRLSSEFCLQELGASFDETSDIPDSIKSQVEEWREKLIESAVELDDDVMERYLEVRLQHSLLQPCTA